MTPDAQVKCTSVQLLFHFFCKYTRNVYKSTVETSVQCNLSKLKMNITLNSFCTSHDKWDCHFQQQNKFSVKSSGFRQLKWELKWTRNNREQIIQSKTITKKRGMALVLIPKEGFIHLDIFSRIYFPQTLLTHQDNQPSFCIGFKNKCT